VKRKPRPEDKAVGAERQRQGRAPINCGDLTMPLVIDTDNLEKCVNETIERLQKALQAFKDEWNRSRPEARWAKAEKQMKDSHRELYSAMQKLDRVRSKQNERKRS
jgi:hypothetical protein